MSTTTPFGSSVSARNAASITKVAPCSACAGPNISPRNEWAIMMRSRTSTAYMRTSTCFWIIDELAQDRAHRCQDFRNAHRQLGERHAGREQRIEPRVGEQVEGSGDAPRMGPTRPVRRRDLADLARDQLEAAAVEGAAERRRDVAGAVPAHLEHGGLVAGEAECGGQPGSAAAR